MSLDVYPKLLSLIIDGANDIILCTTVYKAHSLHNLQKTFDPLETKKQVMLLITYNPQCDVYSKRGPEI